MKLETIKWIAIIILFYLLLFTCKRTNINNKVDDRKIENRIIEKTIYHYKDSIIYRDSIIFTYVSIKDSISKSNKNSLEIHYDKQMDSLNVNRIDYRDTLIDNLVYEIEIDDTIIKDLTKTIEYRDTVIHNLEIMNETNKLYIEDVEKELIKSEKKIKRNKIWAWIMTGVAAITTTILIVK